MHSRIKNKYLRKDIKFVLNNLRNQDVEELKTAHGENWKRFIYKNLLKIPDDCCLIGYIKDKPVFIYGVVPAGNDIGVIWMLSTQDITSYQKSFLRKSMRYINDSLKNFKLLCNYVHSKNYLAIKWLEWLGFCVENPYLEGLGKKQFLYFYKEGQNV